MKNSTRITSNFLLVFTFIFSSFFFCSLVKAQTVSDTLNSSTEFYNYNQNPIYENHVSYQKTVWRRSSLKEKQNQPFFVKGNEITKVIIDAVKLGIIQPYRNDSLKTEMSKNEFLENIYYEELNLSEELMMMSCWGGFKTENWSANTQEFSLDSNEYRANQCYILETKTNIFFDKTRSRMISDIESISIILPAEMNPETGLEKTIATFSYKELVQNLFRDNSSAIYYNEKNNQAHQNLEEAFDLMLLSGRLIKYSNAKDNHIIDIYDNYNQTLLVGQNYEATLIEYESSLWEN